MLSISHNWPEIDRRLDQLAKDVAERAQASTLNKAIEQGRTQMQREITGEYAVSAAYVRERLRIKRATFKQGRLAMTVSLSGSGSRAGKRAANVIAFGARETRKGLTVKIKRSEGRKVIKDAFIGNKGRTVFKRTGKDRLPIEPVQTIDVPQMFNSRRIKTKVLQVIVDRIPVIFEREAAFYVARFNGGK